MKSEDRYIPRGGGLVSSVALPGGLGPSGTAASGISLMGRYRRHFLAQTQDDNLRQMIEIQKRINALADTIPAGAIPKEQADAFAKRISECAQGTAQGVECMRRIEADFSALVAASKGAPAAAPAAGGGGGIPKWAWIAGGAGAAILLGALAVRLLGKD